MSRIEAHDDDVRSFLSVDAEGAVNRARAVDALVARGDDLPLAGVPVAVKDNVMASGQPTTGGSRILDGFEGAYPATAVARLEAAGAVVVGKTNLDEFGMGSSTENSGFASTKNPWDLDRVPGGSSGGSAAAVAARLVPLALGSDTGGSIRQPASFCGVVGLKPSYGRVSRHGLLAYASSLDTVGPLACSAADTALALSVIAGADGFDGTCADSPVPDYTAELKGGADLRGLSVGVITDAMGVGVDAEVRSAVAGAVGALEALGARAREVALPNLEAATAAYYVLATSEASANLARYDGIRYGVRASADSAKDVYMRSRAEGLGDEVKRRIVLGTFALSSGFYDDYYLKAQRVRALVAADFRAAFASGVDVLVSPVAPTPAFRLGEKTENQVDMYLDDRMSVPASLAGLPALSVPCGFTKEGLPIGLQIIGPYLAEAAVLEVGHAYQTATDFHEREPAMSKRETTAV